MSKTSKSFRKYDDQDMSDHKSKVLAKNLARELDEDIFDDEDVESYFDDPRLMRMVMGKR